LHYTGSTRARALLDDWANCRPKFVKVMPVEYRRALEEMARQQVVERDVVGGIEIGLRGNGK
jgi:glutamate synthase (NADPH/NADH) large chain